MTDIRTTIAELRELEKKATAGPWVWRVPGYLCNKYIDDGMVLWAKCNRSHADHEHSQASILYKEGGHDAAFIREIRNSLIPLLDHIEKVETENEELKLDMEHWMNASDQ